MSYCFEPDGHSTRRISEPHRFGRRGWTLPRIFYEQRGGKIIAHQPVKRLPALRDNPNNGVRRQNPQHRLWRGDEIVRVLRRKK